jgi:hypothetical protein
VTAQLPRLGDLLIESGAVTAEQVDTAVRRQRQNGGRLGTNLVELGFIDERELTKVLSSQLAIPAATAAQIEGADAWVLAMVPRALAQKHRVVPIREDGDRLWLAMADPTDRLAREELERMTGKSVRAMVAPELVIQLGLEHCYGVKREHSRPVALPKTDPNLKVEDVNVIQDRDHERLDVHTGMMPERTPVARVAVARPSSPQQPSSLNTELLSAMSEGDVLEVAVRVIERFAPRVIVLLNKDGVLRPWHSIGFSDEKLAELRALADEVPALRAPLGTGETFVGALPAGALGPIGDKLGIGATTGILLPLSRSQKMIGCIIAVDATAESRAHVADFDQLAVKLNHALCMTYYRRMLVES